MTTEYKVIGKSVRAVDGPDKVTGRARYALDMAPPNALRLKYLRSPVPHARVTNIDASRALALPGVHGVLTGDDVPDIRAGNLYVDEPILASADRVRFIGDKVAAVVAEDADIADAALAVIDVTYEELPALLDPEEAAKPDAMLLHPEYNSYRGVEQLDELSNNYGRMVHEWGDIDAAFREADVIIEREFRTPRVHQAYLEPHACVVDVDEQGRAHIWMSCQMPTGRRPHLARVMGLPREDVIIHPVPLGGSFGGKMDPTGVAVGYFLAKQTGRPVKWVMDYAEEFSAMNPRHPSVVRVRVGARNDGMIIAWDAEGFFATGAYAAYAPVPAYGGLLRTSMVEPYRVENVRIISNQVYTNTVPCGYFRGPGLMQSVFASESVIDELAARLDLDPLDVRLRNIVRASSEAHPDRGWSPVTRPGLPGYQAMRAEEILRAAVETAEYNRTPLPNVGRGIALHGQSDTGFDSPAAVTIQPDGRVVVNTMTYDPGVGTGTILAQIVAEELGLPIERVTVEAWSTEAGVRDWGIGGQRGARVSSRAAFEASQEAKKNLRRLAAEFYGWTEESIKFEDGKVSGEGRAAAVAIEDIAARAGEPVGGQVSVDEGDSSPYISFGAHIAEVRVDPETGKVTLLRYTAAHETGRVLNPMGFEGQIEGGSVQGIGHALSEELVEQDGSITNPSFADYKLQTQQDGARMKVVVLESDTGHGPYQVRGIGDTPIVLSSPAIANAVAAASGARIRQLPITAEKVYRATRDSD
ncbi:MAG: xanthine dehydrogenase family protein molybdopterin-binding subunit [Dehalococcoidia bacterium]|nr:xanthine dehydrogenase family protein molybdopterin-binding subunit [Dehalococcoidia bacterium]